MAAPYALALQNTSTKEVCDALNEVRFPYEVAVYGSKNAFNFGAILRTGNAFLCKRYYAIDIDWYYKKAAMTAHRFERQNVVKCSMDEFIEQTAGRNIVAFEKREGIETESINDFVYPVNPILLFGNESDGVPNQLLSVASRIVSIPMYGTIWDLNIALAAGIAMHHFVAQHTKKIS